MTPAESNMIFNATLISVTSPAAMTARGGQQAGSTTSKGVRCFLDQPEGKALLGARAVHVDTTAVAYVPLADAAGIVERGEATFALDQLIGQTTYRVLKVGTHVKSNLSHKVIHLGSK